MPQTGDVPSPCVCLRFTESTLRTHHISKELRDVGLVGQRVDFLYDFVVTCFPFAELTSPQVCRRGPGQPPDRHTQYVSSFCSNLHLSDGSSSPDDLRQSTRVVLGR